MRNLFPLFLVSMLLTACVDKAYDLENINTDDITIGGEGDGENETSEFKIPLATVRVGMDEIADSGTNVQEIFAEADVWLPTTLDGGYADIKQLQDNPDYVDGMLSKLIDEMIASDEKLRAVTDKIWDKYKTQFLHLIPGITGDETAEEFYDAFKTVFRDEADLREQLADEVRNLARSYLTYLSVDELSYDIERLDLSSEVVDMLVQNLDPKETPDARNTLHLYGEIISELPLTMFFEAQFTQTEVLCPIRVEANQPSSPIEPTRIYEEDLRQIAEGTTIVIPVTFEKYYPGIGFDDTARDQIIIKLRLVKRGGLTIKL